MDPARQLDDMGRLRHLLTLRGLPRETYQDLFGRAEGFMGPGGSSVARTESLRGSLVVNAFFEPSTRTRLAFEIAARSLGADVVNFDLLSSATQFKSESFEDTLRTIAALGADFIVLRHGGEMPAEGLLEILPKATCLVNGGEGSDDHPSQGLLDAWTIQREKGGFDGLRIAIFGDILHSRVARSLAHAFATLGAGSVTVSGPPKLVPESLEGQLKVTVDHDPDRAVAGADVIICLRFQYERMGADYEAAKGRHNYTIDEGRVALASSEVMVMHPGPINRGVEIAPEVADGPRSFILSQVRNGVAMRMAILDALGEGRRAA